jgi:hypothetical protein
MRKRNYRAWTSNGTISSPIHPSSKSILRYCHKIHTTYSRLLILKYHMVVVIPYRPHRLICDFNSFILVKQSKQIAQPKLIMVVQFVLITSPTRNYRNQCNEMYCVLFFEHFENEESWLLHVNKIKQIKQHA